MSQLTNKCSCVGELRAVSHVRKNQTVTEKETDLHRLVLCKPFTYEPIPLTKSMKMYVFV